MEYVYIGKIVSTHGIKGEIKIISDFDYKDKVFKKGINIYIGQNHCHEVINTYQIKNLPFCISLIKEINIKNNTA